MPEKELFCLTCGAAALPGCARERHSFETIDNRPLLVNEEVIAARLVERYGEKLVGRTVDTPAFNDYPGGHAVVIEIQPDARAPEIAFQVMHPTFGEIGVFEYEEVTLLPVESGGGSD